MIETERLRLVPLSLPDAEAIVHGIRPEGAIWAEGYPLDGTLVSASLLVTARAEGRTLGDFGSYQIVHRESRMVIGDCGFFSSPDDGDVLHVACELCHGMRGNGYATEALGALLAWVRGLPDQPRLIAEATTPEGQRLLERVGMREFERRERLVYYGG
jgi:RimJ/RimL family protein N-acetyltransferase